MQANPDAFGAGIAKGTEQLGQGVQKAGDFFNQVQTDAATNNTMDGLNNIMDNFRSLRGEDALNAQKGIYQQGQKILDDNREGLNTPGQKLNYDTITRNFYQRYFSGIIASHADQQAKEYTTQTNDAKFKNALTGAANVADDDAHVEGFKEMAREAAVKEVMNQGNGNDPDIVKAAIARADAATYKTVAEIRAVKDKAGALAYIQKHSDALGPEYAPLADQFQHGADEQSGTAAALATRGAAPSGPALPGRPAPGSYSFTAATHESSMGANMGNPAAAYGPYQFEPGTWRGLQKNHPELQLSDATGNPTTDGRRDWGQATRAYEVFTKENRATLQTAGIHPNDKNTFMAAFLGASGATHFIQQMWADPSQNAAALFPKEAGYNHDVFFDHGQPRTLQQVYDLQTRMFAATQSPAGSDVSRGTPAGEGGTSIVNAGSVTPISTGTPPAAAPLPTPAGEGVTPAAITMTPPSVVESPEARLAARYQQIADNPNLTDGAKSIAYQKIAQDEQRQQIMEMATQKARKDRTEERADYYGKQMLDGSATDKTYDELVNDPAFDHDPETRIRLGKALQQSIDDGVIGSAKTNGAGYWDAKNRILLPYGDPRRINDISDIYKETGIRPDGTVGTITPTGAAKLVGMMRDVQKSAESSNVQRSLMTWLNDYAKPKITFDGQDNVPGLKPQSDPEGREAFARFASAFEIGLDKAVKQGMDPEKYLSQKNVDDMMVPYVRSAAKMRMDRLAAEPDQPETPGTPIPQPPQGANPIGWTHLMAQVPMRPDGSLMSHDHWSRALQILLRDKDEPGTIQAWNNQAFGRAGWKAEDILGTLSPPAAGEAASTQQPSRPITPDIGYMAPADLKAAIAKQLGPRAPGSIEGQQ